MWSASLCWSKGGVLFTSYRAAKLAYSTLFSSFAALVYEPAVTFLHALTNYHHPRFLPRRLLNCLCNILFPSWNHPSFLALVALSLLSGWTVPLSTTCACPDFLCLEFKVISVISVHLKKKLAAWEESFFQPRVLKALTPITSTNHHLD